MQAGTLAGGDIREAISRVLVNGVERNHVSWSAGRELSGDLPDQVLATNGVMQADGTVVWSSTDDVESGGRNPWNRSTGWVPNRGDRVEIWSGDGITAWKQFHGVIDKTSGSINGGFQSTLIDDIDRLSAPFTHPAMLRIMPPQATDGSESYRSVGLHPIYYVDRALRGCGFYCTPPREYETKLYVPLQGSRWPHFGQLNSATGFFNTVAPWGLGTRDGNADFIPYSGQSMGTPVQLSLMVAPDHAGPVDVYLGYVLGGGVAHHLRLSVNGSRNAVALKNGTEVCRVALGDATLVSMLAKDGTISLRTNTGQESSGSFVASGSTMSIVRLNAAADASVAGLQVSQPEVASHEHASTRWAPTAVLDASSLQQAGIIDAAPAIDRSSTDLLKEINDAILAVLWIDELGIMRWTTSDALRRRIPVRTVTTLEDVLSLDWQTGLLESSSQVTVTGQQPAVSKGRWKNLVLARGTGESLKSGDELAIFLEPESGEDWVLPSVDFIEVGGSEGIWGSYNNPSYSAVGLYYTTDGGQTSVSGLGCSITTEQVGLQKVLVKYAAGAWPSDVEGVVATSPTAGTLWPKNRNQDLPRLVGRGKIKWSGQEVSATGAGGPGPALVHDAGYWANRTDSTEILDRIASYLQAQTATPLPVITGLEVVDDPRLQLGDVITVSSERLMGVTMNALIVGMGRSGDKNGTALSLSVRIISVAATFATYEEYFESLAAANLTYTQWDALGPKPHTYEQFNDAE